MHQTDCERAVDAFGGEGAVVGLADFALKPTVQAVN